MVGNLGKHHFNHRGSLQKLAQDCLGSNKECKPRFNLRGSLQKLVQDYLDAGIVVNAISTTTEAFRSSCMPV